MNYELFQANSVKAFDHCRDVKSMVSDMQQALSAVPGMVRKNERLEKEKAELKAENAALKVELDDWKGNAEGFQPDAYMRLPLDADGVPIRLGDTVWYVGSDVVIPKDCSLKVAGFVRMHGVPGTFIETRECPAAVIKPKWLSHRAPEPPESWEKLEEDALKNPCRYFGMFEDQRTSCTACPHGPLITHRICGENMRLDLIERAKRLAGIKEQEGGERTAIADKKGER